MRRDLLSIPPNRITIFDWGRLIDLAKLKEKMGKYNEVGLITLSNKLNKLYMQATHAAALLAKIEEQQRTENIYKSGDILMVHSKKSHILKNKAADNETILTHRFISKFGHSAQIYIDPKTNQPCLSHIYGNYEISNLTNF